MATFDFVAWGNSNIVGKWVMDTGSGVYRGQCTQVVSELLKDLGYPLFAAARGNGNQVGPNMVVRGEATYEGTNLASIPAGEIHVICKGVGNPATDGHVSVAGIGDIIFEQNVRNGQPTRNFGIGPTYSGRLGRLGEPWRETRYHYKIIVETDYDNVGGDDGGGEPEDDPEGPNQNRFLNGRMVSTKRKKLTDNSAVKTHKKFYAVKTTRRGISQG